MMDKRDLAAAFRALHVPGKPLVLFNIWDAGSAGAVAAAGAPAIATGSWAVAAVHGAGDGETLPLELVLANLARIVGTVGVPVTLDLESGYGTDPQGVGRSVGQAIIAGAVGLNIEDSVPGARTLRPVEEAAARYAAARQAADEVGVNAFLNARTDVFLLADGGHDMGLVEEALARADAYAAAGADGLFVPGLADPALIGAVTARSPLPVNVMMGKATPPVSALAALGVARVSHGHGPYVEAMQALEAAARAAMGIG